MTRTSRRKLLVTTLATMFVLGAAFVSPSSAHDTSNIGHNWRRHYRQMAKRIFYTKATSDARFVNVGERASDSDLLDGQSSAAFAAAAHGHAGEDIASGTVAEARIAAALARDAEVFGIVTDADGPNSGLDADLLDGQSSAAFAAAAHGHAGEDIASGTVAEARIAAALARDAEVFGIVTDADGPNSGLDADLLDGQSSGAFAPTAHTHAGGDITSGTVDESVIDSLIARVADVVDIVLAADGPGSGLDADLLDGLTSAAFAAATHAHAGGDITSGTIDEPRIAAALARDVEVLAIVTANDGPGSGLDADSLDGLSSEAFAVAGTESVRWFKEAADGLPSATTTERVVFTAPADLTITEVLMEPAGALAANSTNHATIIVSRRDADGGGRTTIDSITTQPTGTGNWTAFGTISLGGVATPSVSAGQKVTVEITKSGIGVVVPVMALQVEYTVD